jgi:hypothetical protein
MRNEFLKRLARIGQLAFGIVRHGMIHPAGAILADRSQQARNNSNLKLSYYVDQSFTCVDCGAQEIWTAQNQKWYFEVVKGPIQATARRCLPCRGKQRDRKEKSRSQYPPEAP